MRMKVWLLVAAGLLTLVIVKVSLLSGAVPTSWLYLLVPALLALKLLGIRIFLARRRTVVASRPSHPEW